MYMYIQVITFLICKCIFACLALEEIMISRMGLSPECEQSLLHICHDDPDKLTELTKTARIHGHRFSRYTLNYVYM